MQNNLENKADQAGFKLLNASFSLKEKAECNKRLPIEMGAVLMEIVVFKKWIAHSNEEELKNSENSPILQTTQTFY